MDFFDPKPEFLSDTGSNLFHRLPEGSRAGRHFPENPPAQGKYERGEKSRCPRLPNRGSEPMLSFGCAQPPVEHRKELRIQEHFSDQGRRCHDGRDQNCHQRYDDPQEEDGKAAFIQIEIADAKVRHIKIIQPGISSGEAPKRSLGFLFRNDVADL